MCTESGAKLISESIRNYDLNRIVVAACTPRTHAPVFEQILKENNLDSSYLEFVNIREQCSYIHLFQPIEAIDKTKNLLRAAIARSLKAERIGIRMIKLNPTALIIGSGIAGIRTALDLGYQGFKVHLVEKEPSIGGLMAKFDRIFPTDDCCI
ncbi:MAG: CoB--CoM heterodisulfide reductase iron-sulfur subunit A family protein [Candidatus Lokiarchaeota archaeon]|nr:CoB--CoM heterodisulfide reductase iron-sulfur subunit A family protein [Candidatus Lokiarchaeota archaeon]